MSKLPIWPLDVDKWLGSTTVRLMSITAEGIYLRLCMAQWADEFLPNNLKKLATLAKASAKEWREFDEFLDEVFPVDSDGHRRNPKVAEDRRFVLEKVEKRRQAGALGGVARARQADSKPLANATGMPEQKDSKHEADELANGKQYNKQDKDIDSPKSPEGTLFPDGNSDRFQNFQDFFSEFKIRYPKRAGSQNWPQVEKKLKPIWQANFEAILAGCDGYCRALEANGKLGTEFVKMASTWVNQRGWEDEYPSEKQTSEPQKSYVDRSEEPVLGIDYELRRDEESDCLRKYKLGSDELFDEEAWRRGE
jgi:uncharacterized protein YdaU (DUF1376 family)